MLSTVQTTLLAKEGKYLFSNNSFLRLQITEWPRIREQQAILEICEVPKTINFGISALNSLRTSGDAARVRIATQTSGGSYRRTINPHSAIICQACVSAAVL